MSQKMCQIKHFALYLLNITQNENGFCQIDFQKPKHMSKITEHLIPNLAQRKFNY